MPYAVKFLPAAVHELKKLPKKASGEITEELEKLSKGPYSHPSVKRMENQPRGIYRLRVKNYRIVYEVRDNTSLIVVAKVGHRKDIYRLLPERLKSLKSFER